MVTDTTTKQLKQVNSDELNQIIKDTAGRLSVEGTKVLTDLEADNRKSYSVHKLLGAIAELSASDVVPLKEALGELAQAKNAAAKAKQAANKAKIAADKKALNDELITEAKAMLVDAYKLPDYEQFAKFVDDLEEPNFKKLDERMKQRKRKAEVTLRSCDLMLVQVKRRNKATNGSGSEGEEQPKKKANKA